MFHTFIICQVEKDNFYCARYTRHLPDSYSIVEFIKEESGLCTLESRQLDKRLFRYNSQKYNYVLGRLILCVQEDGVWNYVAGASGSDKIISMEVDLPPGTYRLLIIMDWISQIYDVNISYYGREKVELTRQNCKYDKNLIAKLMFSESKLRGI